MKGHLVTVYSVFLLAVTPCVFGDNESGYPGPGYVPDPYVAETPMHRPYDYGTPARVRIEKALYEEGYLLRVYAQGITAEDIDVSVADHGRLRLRSVMSSQRDWRSENPYRRSSFSSHGSISRTIRLPYDADASKLTTTVKDGVLEIRIPRL
jgi:HSP20 family molecular chaperone IbpA